MSADFKLKDKFVLDASACWILTIELDCPIETVALQCDVDVELIDVESNISIVSRSKVDGDGSTPGGAPTTPSPAAGGSKLLASYRNTESTNRMDIKIRSVEGQFGTLQAFIIPALSPKTAQLASYQIRPLSLHQRLTEKPPGLDTLLVNTLTVEGKFSLSDMNSWISQCLPDVPEKSQGDDLVYYFRSTFLSTILVTKFREKEGTFRCDNVSVLAILKDFITKQATSRKIQIKSQFDIKDETCVNVLSLMHPKLEYQLGLSEKVKLIEALKEIEMQEQDVAFMSDEYKDTLSKAKQITKEFELQPRRLEFLHSIVKNLYLDKFKFKGQNMSHKLPVLQAHLEKYNLKEIQTFFAQN